MSNESGVPVSRGTGEGDSEGVSWIARTFPGSTCIGCGEGVAGAMCPKCVTREILALVDERDKATAEVQRLRGVVEEMEKVACEGYRHWDNDEDSRAGKALAALAGSTGLRPKLDALRAALTPPAADTEEGCR